MDNKFKRLKEQLNYLKNTYRNIEIMYIGLFDDDQEYNYTIAWYLPRVDYILGGKRPFNSTITFVDNFNIELENIKDNFEISLLDIRYIKEYKDSSFMHALIKSQYRIINKDYKCEILTYINGLYTVLEGTYLDRLVNKYVKDKMNWIDKWEDTRKFVDLNEYIKKYNNIFVTSDLHLFHKNILKYENCRESLLPQTKLQYITESIIEEMLNQMTNDTFFKRMVSHAYKKYDKDNPTDSRLLQVNMLCRKYREHLYSDLYVKAVNKFYEDMIVEHNKKLIDNYNSIVNKNDLCFILGDFSLGKAKETENILKQLNGDKILLRGNHDSFLKDNSFNKDLFLGIYDYLEVKLAGQGVVLSHYPLLHFKKQDYEKGNIHLYGHTHTAEIYKPYHSFHVGVDTNQYKPISLQYAIEQARLEETNKPRYINKEVEK